MKHISEYIFCAHWYNESIEEDATDYGIVMANSYTEATEKIESRLPGLTKLEIHQLQDWDFVWMTEEVYNKFIDDPEYMIGEK